MKINMSKKEKFLADLIKKCNVLKFDFNLTKGQIFIIDTFSDLLLAKYLEEPKVDSYEE